MIGVIGVIGVMGGVIPGRRGTNGRASTITHKMDEPGQLCAQMDEPRQSCAQNGRASTIMFGEIVRKNVRTVFSMNSCNLNERTMFSVNSCNLNERTMFSVNSRNLC